MGLIRSLFWLSVFLAATFCFTVLFEHGPSNFKANAQKDYESLSKILTGKIEKKKDESDKIAH